MSFASGKEAGTQPASFRAAWGPDRESRNASMSKYGDKPN